MVRPRPTPPEPAVRAVSMRTKGRNTSAGRAGDLAEDGREVGQLGLLLALAAREGEIGVDHALHLRDVGLEAADIWLVAEHRELELHARERRAQVVADAGEHLGALDEET